MKPICLIVAAAATGCIYADVKAPLAYRAATAVEAKATGAAAVEGIACNKAVLGLAGWAERGVREAVRDAQSQAPGATPSDLRADVRFVNIVIFRRECIEVTAAAR